MIFSMILMKWKKSWKILLLNNTHGIHFGPGKEIKMKRATLSSIIVILSVILLSASSAFTQDIKERMKDRLPVIIDLKNKGVIGENNLGYLEFVGTAREKQDVVRDENKDRETVYKAIAKKQNTTAEKVGKRRAQQIAKKADPGEWLKNEKGKWYQK